MKNLFITILLTCLSLLSAKAQPGLNIAQQHRVYIDSLLATVGIAPNTIATGILYDRAIAIANSQRFKQTDILNRGIFLQSTLELRNGAYDTLTHHTVDMLSETADHYTYRRNIAPIGISYNEITHIDTLAVEKGYIIIDGQGRPRPTGRLKTHGLIDKEIFMAAVLSDKKELDAQTGFIIPKELVMGNKRERIAQIEVDFGDGLGFRSITPGLPVSVAYQNGGVKTISTRITTLEGETLNSISNISVKDNTPFRWGEYGYIDEDIYHKIDIYADIPFSGSNGNFKGLGWLTILLNDTDQGLRKPVLVVDGFDPGNQNDAKELFKKYLNTPAFPFANELHAAGYDLVILDFPKAANETILEEVCVDWDWDEQGFVHYCIEWEWQPKVIDAGADYIQRNAYVAVKVIETLNGQILQSGSNEELVVIGPSMGGLITRYALAYMELQPSLNHNTRLWVSFDSPHKGANIPIGLQHFINYFYSMSYGAWSAKEYMLNSKAARQMLIHHVNSNSEVPTGDPGWNPAWQSELASMGFPQQPRRVSISNGSLNGTTDVTPGSKAFYFQANVKGSSWRWRAKSDVFNTGSYNARTKVFWGNTKKLFDEETKYARGLSGSYSLDNSPGGTRNTYETLPMLVNSDDYDFYWTIYSGSYSFIPTKSALAFTGSSADLKETLYNRNLVVTGETPFHSYWGPVNKNMGHIAFDANLMCWVLSEINGNPIPPTINYQISGPTTVCSSNTTFTLNNLPAGCTVSWSRSSNLAFVSSTTNSYTVKAASSSTSGTGWVQAVVSGPCGDVELPPHDVWVGTPQPVQPLVHYDLGLNAACKGHTHTASTAQHSGVTDYRWRLIYPDGFSWDLPSGSRSTTFCIDDTGWYSVAVKQRIEGCSWSGEVQRTFPVENCGTGERCGGGGLVPKLIVSPNPTSYELTITEVEPANDHIPWTLRLMSQRGAVMVNVTATLPKTINVQGLQPGVFVLHARRGEYIEQLRVVVE